MTYTSTYDTAARLTTLQSNLVDSNHPGTLLTVNQYNPLGEIQQATLGNGIVQNAVYDKLGRIISRTDGSLYSFSLGYAPNSNILTGNDSVNGNWTYSYDDFNRVATSSKSGQAFNYQYDRFSNRWKQNATVGSGPQPSYTFDANNHITNSGVTYDAAGNITNDGFHSYTYDAEGHLMTVDAGSTAKYVYTPAGQRTESVTPSNTVDFIFDQAGRVIGEANSSGWQRGELYAGGLHVASYANSTTYFDHSDWLGTVRALSTVSGANYQNCSSLPFGDAQTCTGSPWYPLQFTGDQHDNESNLEHTLFRQYSSTQGRWTVPDPAGMAAVNPADPQTWNRYAYVGNRPMNTTDALGLDGNCDPDFDPFCNPCDDPFFCTDPCDQEPIACDPVEGGDNPGPPSHVHIYPQRTGGVWPNNETLGLPPGINFPAMSLGTLLGLNPNGPCDFGVCAPVGNGLLDASGLPIHSPEWINLGLELSSTFAFASFGRQTTVSMCHSISNKTTMAHGDFTCEGGAAGSETVSNQVISLATLQKKCGPISSCPRSITTETSFFVLGPIAFGKDIKVTSCLP